jgi:hypothetical protein
MKKHGLLLAACAMLLVFGACDNNSQKQATKEDVEQTVQETTVTTSPDLVFFELQGPVKRCDLVEFDRNGKITSVDGQDPFALEKPQRDMNDDGEVVDYCRWTRDAQGQIDSILCYEYMDEYRWHDGRVTQVLSGYEGQLWLTDREYDADGRLVKTKQYEVVETDGPEEVNLMWVTEYTYLEFDDHGNWTLRKQTDTDQVVEYVNETEVSREIEYY